MAVERQEARERRRVAHREVVEAGGAVGDAREHDAVLVDVVGALQAVEDRVDVLDLRAAPPRRIAPGDGHHVDLLGAFEGGAAAASSGGARLAGLAPHDAAVQLHADLIFARRVVVERHVQVVEEVARHRAPLELHESAFRLRGIGASALQPRQRLVEGDAGPDDGLHRLGRILWRARAPEFLEGGVDRRRRRGPHDRGTQQRAADEEEPATLSRTGHRFSTARNPAGRGRLRCAAGPGRCRRTDRRS